MTVHGYIIMKIHENDCALLYLTSDKQGHLDWSNNIEHAILPTQKRTAKDYIGFLKPGTYLILPATRKG